MCFQTGFHLSLPLPSFYAKDLWGPCSCGPHSVTLTLLARSIALSNWWFVAHLTDLLDHCKLLQSHNL